MSYLSHQLTDFCKRSIELTTADLREIDNELSKINVQGARLDEGLLSMSED